MQPRLLNFKCHNKHGTMSSESFNWDVKQLNADITKFDFFLDNAAKKEEKLKQLKKDLLEKDVCTSVNLHNYIPKQHKTGSGESTAREELKMPRFATKRPQPSASARFSPRIRIERTRKDDGRLPLNGNEIEKLREKANLPPFGDMKMGKERVEDGETDAAVLFQKLIEKENLEPTHGGTEEARLGRMSKDIADFEDIGSFFPEVTHYRRKVASSQERHPSEPELLLNGREDPLYHEVPVFRRKVARKETPATNEPADSGIGTNGSSRSSPETQTNNRRDVASKPEASRRQEEIRGGREETRSAGGEGAQFKLLSQHVDGATTSLGEKSKNGRDLSKKLASEAPVEPEGGTDIIQPVQLSTDAVDQGFQFDGGAQLLPPRTDNFAQTDPFDTRTERVLQHPGAIFTSEAQNPHVRDKSKLAENRSRASLLKKSEHFWGLNPYTGDHVSTKRRSTDRPCCSQSKAAKTSFPHRESARPTQKREPSSGCFRPTNKGTTRSSSSKSDRVRSSRSAERWRETRPRNTPWARSRSRECLLEPLPEPPKPKRCFSEADVDHVGAILTAKNSVEARPQENPGVKRVDVLSDFEEEHSAAIDRDTFENQENLNHAGVLLSSQPDLHLAGDGQSIELRPLTERSSGRLKLFTDRPLISQVQRQAAESTAIKTKNSADHIAASLLSVIGMNLAGCGELIEQSSANFTDGPLLSQRQSQAAESTASKAKNSADHVAYLLTASDDANSHSRVGPLMTAKDELIPSDVRMQPALTDHFTLRSSDKSCRGRIVSGGHTQGGSAGVTRTSPPPEKIHPVRTKTMKVANGRGRPAAVNRVRPDNVENNQSVVTKSKDPPESSKGSPDPLRGALDTPLPEGTGLTSVADGAPHAQSDGLAPIGSASTSTPAKLNSTFFIPVDPTPRNRKPAEGPKTSSAGKGRNSTPKSAPLQAPRYLSEDIHKFIDKKRKEQLGKDEEERKAKQQEQERKEKNLKKLDEERKKLAKVPVEKQVKPEALKKSTKKPISTDDFKQRARHQKTVLAEKPVKTPADVFKPSADNPIIPITVTRGASSHERVVPGHQESDQVFIKSLRNANSDSHRRQAPAVASNQRPWRIVAEQTSQPLKASTNPKTPVKDGECVVPKRKPHQDTSPQRRPTLLLRKTPKRLMDHRQPEPPSREGYFKLDQPLKDQLYHLFAEDKRSSGTSSLVYTAGSKEPRFARSSHFLATSSQKALNQDEEGHRDVPDFRRRDEEIRRIQVENRLSGYQQILTGENNGAKVEVRVSSFTVSQTVSESTLTSNSFSDEIAKVEQMLKLLKEQSRKPKLKEAGIGTFPLYSHSEDVKRSDPASHKIASRKSVTESNLADVASIQISGIDGTRPLDARQLAHHLHQLSEPVQPDASIAGPGNSHSFLSLARDTVKTSALDDIDKILSVVRQMSPQANESHASTQYVPTEDAFSQKIMLLQNNLRSLSVSTVSTDSDKTNYRGVDLRRKVPDGKQTASEERGVERSSRERSQVSAQRFIEIRGPLNRQDSIQSGTVLSTKKSSQTAHVSVQEQSQLKRIDTGKSDVSPSQERLLEQKCVEPPANLQSKLSKTQADSQEVSPFSAHTTASRLRTDSSKNKSSASHSVSSVDTTLSEGPLDLTPQPPAVPHKSRTPPIVEAPPTYLEARGLTWLNLSEDLEYTADFEENTSKGLSSISFSTISHPESRKSPRVDSSADESVVATVTERGGTPRSNIVLSSPIKSDHNRTSIRTSQVASRPASSAKSSSGSSTLMTVGSHPLKPSADGNRQISLKESQQSHEFLPSSLSGRPTNFKRKTSRQAVPGSSSVSVETVQSSSVRSVPSPQGLADKCPLPDVPEGLVESSTTGNTTGTEHGSLKAPADIEAHESIVEQPSDSILVSRRDTSDEKSKSEKFSSGGLRKAGLDASFLGSIRPPAISPDLKVNAVHSYPDPSTPLAYHAQVGATALPSSFLLEDLEAGGSGQKLWSPTSRKNVERTAAQKSLKTVDASGEKEPRTSDMAVQIPSKDHSAVDVAAPVVTVDHLDWSRKISAAVEQIVEASKQMQDVAKVYPLLNRISVSPITASRSRSSPTPSEISTASLETSPVSAELEDLLRRLPAEHAQLLREELRQHSTLIQYEWSTMKNAVKDEIRSVQMDLIRARVDKNLTHTFQKKKRAIVAGLQKDKIRLQGEHIQAVERLRQLVLYQLALKSGHQSLNGTLNTSAVRIKPPLSPSVRRRVRTESTESESSRLNDTCSEASENEGRMLAITEAIRQRRAKAKELKENREKIDTDSVKAKEDAKNKQLKAVDEDVKQLESQLRQLIEHPLSHAARPVIRKPRVRQESPELSIDLSRSILELSSTQAHDTEMSSSLQHAHESKAGANLESKAGANLEETHVKIYNDSASIPSMLSNGLSVRTGLAEDRSVSIPDSGSSASGSVQDSRNKDGPKRAQLTSSSRCMKTLESDARSDVPTENTEPLSARSSESAYTESNQVETLPESHVCENTPIPNAEKSESKFQDNTTKLQGNTTGEVRSLSSVSSLKSDPLAVVGNAEPSDVRSSISAVGSVATESTRDKQTATSHAANTASVSKAETVESKDSSISSTLTSDGIDLKVEEMLKEMRLVSEIESVENIAPSTTTSALRVGSVTSTQIDYNSEQIRSIPFNATFDIATHKGDMLDEEPEIRKVGSADRVSVASQDDGSERVLSATEQESTFVGLSSLVDENILSNRSAIVSDLVSTPVSKGVEISTRLSDKIGSIQKRLVEFSARKIKRQDSIADGNVLVERITLQESDGNDQDTVASSIYSGSSRIEGVKKKLFVDEEEGGSPAPRSVSNRSSVKIVEKDEASSCSVDVPTIVSTEPRSNNIEKKTSRVVAEIIRQTSGSQPLVLEQQGIVERLTGTDLKTSLSENVNGVANIDNTAASEVRQSQSEESRSESGVDKLEVSEHDGNRLSSQPDLISFRQTENDSPIPDEFFLPGEEISYLSDTFVDRAGGSLEYSSEFEKESSEGRQAEVSQDVIEVTPDSAQDDNRIDLESDNSEVESDGRQKSQNYEPDLEDSSMSQKILTEPSEYIKYVSTESDKRSPLARFEPVLGGTHCNQELALNDQLEEPEFTQKLPESRQGQVVGVFNPDQPCDQTLEHRQIGNEAEQDALEQILRAKDRSELYDETNQSEDSVPSEKSPSPSAHDLELNQVAKCVIPTEPIDQFEELDEPRRTSDGKELHTDLEPEDQFEPAQEADNQLETSTDTIIFYDSSHETTPRDSPAKTAVIVRVQSLMAGVEVAKPQRDVSSSYLTTTYDVATPDSSDSETGSPEHGEYQPYREEMQFLDSKELFMKLSALEDKSSPEQEKNSPDFDLESQWMDDDILQSPLSSVKEEAEAIQMRQRKIDMEIQQLQQLSRSGLELSPSSSPQLPGSPSTSPTHRFSGFFYREIPNKPPPPYTPPIRSVNATFIRDFSIIPATVEDVQSFIHMYCTRVFECDVVENISQEIIQKTMEINEGFLTEQELICRSSYAEFLCDLVDEVKREIENPSEYNPRYSHYKYMVKDNEKLSAEIERQVLAELGLAKRCTKENRSVRWCLRKRDRVDEILVRELQSEEREWNDLSHALEAVKSEIAEHLLDSLLCEVAEEMGDSVMLAY